VSGFFSDVRRWERTDHRLTWSDDLLVAYCVFIWGACVGLGMLGNLLGEASPASSALLWCIAGLTAWMALPPPQRRQQVECCSGPESRTGVERPQLSRLLVGTERVQLHFRRIQHTTIPRFA